LDVTVVNDDAEVEPGSKGAAELLVAVRGRPKLVVQMRQRDDRELVGRSQLAKQKRQGD
jgi:hypothetical protein